MALLSFRDVSIGYGGPMLLDKVNLQIEKGERVCLLGRNGEGKTTLIKLINGDVLPDEGTVSIQKGTGMAALFQEVPADMEGSVSAVVAGGLGNIGELFKEYKEVSSSLVQNGSDDLLKQFERIQHEIEAQKGWQIHQHVETVISRLKLNPDSLFENLSAGLKRRVLLSRALVRNPEILLLDEPTNHLDIESINWIEQFLQRFKGTLIFVTHDRMFLQKLATRILEIDRGKLTSWACDYGNFLKRKKAALDAETEHHVQFKKKLAIEEGWIRKGIKARRTRNEGRVRALVKMREERRAWRECQGTVKMQVQEAERTGKLVIEATNITHRYDGEAYIKDFSTTIIRGDRIGIIGPNGSGKSTLLSLLIERVPLQEGNLRTGTNLRTAFFDQLREQLDEEKTVCDNIGDGKEMLTINEKSRHVIGYLKDFLFTPDRARSPVKTLSGGERNRLLLARLFARPSNLLVLDEPTNDLDIETLELLEERLMEYTGTILLVSHDREFLNNVVTSTIVFEGNGHIAEYTGGYDDWLSQRETDFTDRSPIEKKVILKPEMLSSKKSAENNNRSRKLSFNEQRELDGLPMRIEEMEQEQQALYNVMADPSFYQKDGDEISNTKSWIEALEKELETAYQRWEELEAVQDQRG